LKEVYRLSADGVVMDRVVGGATNILAADRYLYSLQLLDHGSTSNVVEGAYEEESKKIIDGNKTATRRAVCVDVLLENVTTVKRIFFR
jgi:hypothetical protein